MPAIKIDTTELSEILRLTPPTQNVMLVGRHGIGKSQIVTEFYRQQGQNVVTFFLGQMSDPGDLIGLMHKNEQSGHSEFLPPFWWPTNAEPIVLFLDELNRARPEILQSVMDLTLNRTLAGKALPPGSRVVAAVNEGEEYQLTDLDPALVSRFNIYQFSPTVEDWLVWAGEKQLDGRVISFIQQNSEYLDGDPKSQVDAMRGFSAELTRTPDRRSWERVAQSIVGSVETNELHIKLIAGMVGATAANQFAKSLRDSAMLSADEVLLRFAKAKPKLERMQTHDLAALNERLILRVQQAGFAEVDKKKVLKNFLAYIQLLNARQQSESCAHLASLLERPRFENAAHFLLGDSQILGLLVDFIEGISID